MRSETASRPAVAASYAERRWKLQAATPPHNIFPGGAFVIQRLPSVKKRLNTVNLNLMIVMKRGAYLLLSALRGWLTKFNIQQVDTWVAYWVGRLT
jgi:hypothetical protein